MKSIYPCYPLLERFRETFTSVREFRLGRILGGSHEHLIKRHLVLTTGSVWDRVDLSPVVTGTPGKTVSTGGRKGLGK